MVLTNAAMVFARARSAVSGLWFNAFAACSQHRRTAVCRLAMRLSHGLVSPAPLPRLKLRNHRLHLRLINLGSDPRAEHVAYGLAYRLTDNAPGRPGRGLGLDTLATKLLGEDFAPLLRIPFGDMQPPAVEAQILHSQVHVGVFVIGVEHKDVRVVVTVGVGIYWTISWEGEQRSC